MPSNTPNTEEERHWVVPKAESHYFVGRGILIDRIQRAIDPVGQPPKKRIFVMNGLGGEGKSELSLQVANQMRQVFWGVFWIDVASTSSAVSSFEVVAAELGLQESDDRVEQVKGHLAKVGCRRNWLLILDNADDDTVDCRKEFIPSGSYGSIIITSRSRDCRRLNTAGYEELGEKSRLTDDECATLLLTTADREDNPPNRREAKEIAGTLGHLPLALVLVGAYIHRTACSLEEYKSVYEQQRDEILEYQPKQGRPRFGSVYATFEASARLLEQSDEPDARNALELLGLLAEFHFKDIPLDLFSDARASIQYLLGLHELDEFARVWKLHFPNLPQCLQLQSASRFPAALSHLRDLALVSENRQNDAETENTQHFLRTVSMHPLVHEWLRLRRVRLNPQEQRQRYLAAISTLCLASGNIVRADGKWDGYAYLMAPHTDWIANKELWVADLKIPTCQERHLAGGVLRILQLLGNESLVLDLASWIIPILRHEQINSVIDLWLICVASNSVTRAGPDEAIKLLLRACEATSCMCLDESAEYWLLPRQSLVSAYSWGGQHDEAIKLCDQVLTIRQGGTPSTASCTIMHYAADAHLKAGNHGKAIKLLEEAIQIEVAIQPGRSIERLRKQGTLAQAYIAGSQYQKAIDLLLGLLALRQSSMVRNHSIWLDLQVELANAYYCTGNDAEAVILLQEVVHVQAHIWKMEDPVRIWAERLLNRLRSRGGV
ncbi:hypothetical protein RB594_006983 [Gaeumannomyces avenae]